MYVGAGSQITQMSATPSPELNKIIEEAGDTYAHIALTRYACGEPLELFGLFASPLTAVQQ